MYPLNGLNLCHLKLLQEPRFGSEREYEGQRDKKVKNAASLRRPDEPDNLGRDKQDALMTVSFVFFANKQKISVLKNVENTHDIN